MFKFYKILLIPLLVFSVFASSPQKAFGISDLPPILCDDATANSAGDSACDSLCLGSGTCTDDFTCECALEACDGRACESFCIGNLKLAGGTCSLGSNNRTCTCIPPEVVVDENCPDDCPVGCDENFQCLPNTCIPSCSGTQDCVCVPGVGCSCCDNIACFDACTAPGSPFTGGQCTGTGCECTGNTNPPPPPPEVGDPDDLSKIINLFFDILMPAAVILGLLLIGKSGFALSTSQGDPRKTQEAKEDLTAAIFGLIFVLLSVAILQAIINTLIVS